MEVGPEADDVRYPDLACEGLGMLRAHVGPYLNLFFSIGFHGFLWISVFF